MNQYMLIALVAPAVRVDLEGLVVQEAIIALKLFLNFTVLLKSLMVSLFQ